MGIYKRWSRINRRNLDRLPDAPGAYELADRHGNVIDIGGTTNLADRSQRSFAIRACGARRSSFDSLKTGIHSGLKPIYKRSS